MELPEQADSSAESIMRPNVLDRLEIERDRVGSTLGYIRDLGEWYQELGNHRPNLYQLQRMASMITNPTNESSFPKTLTNAFYWGEILAYRVQDLMSESEWAEVAYSLSSKAMLYHREAAELLFESQEQFSELGHNDWLQGIGDMIMQELEDETSEFMPPAMEAFIVEMSEALADRGEDRWYMILGFRHITMQVQKKAADAELEAAAEKMSEEDRLALVKEIKRQQRLRKQLEKQFLRLMDKNEIDDIQGRELVDIGEVRERIMESYADHLIAYGPFDATDEEEVDRVANYLTQTMNRDFHDMVGIEVDDFLQVGGNAVSIFYDNESLSQDIYMLDENEFIEGTVAAQPIAIVEIPSAQKMLRLQEGLVDIDELQEDVNQLGVVLMLKDAVTVDGEKEHAQVGGDTVVGVVMSNPDMHMSKYLF